jgi:hypothetical protein
MKVRWQHPGFPDFCHCGRYAAFKSKFCHGHDRHESVAARNAAIIADRKLGMTYDALGRKYDLTSSRIGQIVKRGS